MRESVLLTEHGAAGARLAARPEAPDHPAVLTFGDVPGEYRAAREACALLDDTDRGAVGVGGGEAAAFLHRLLAGEVSSLAPGGGNRNLLLSPKGRVLHDFDLFREVDGFRLSTGPGGGAGLAAALDTYLFTEDVGLEERTGSVAPLSLCGPEASGVLARIFGPIPELADHGFLDLAFGGGTVRLAAVPLAGSPGFRVDAGPERAPELWRALVEAGARPIGVVVRDILRVEAGAALQGIDFTDQVYPQEARLEEAFGLDKGCYVGQEVVAKIDTYGGLNKRLMGLSVDHDDPVPAGTRLLREEDGVARDLGVATSWAYSFALGAGMVLAYVKHRHQAVGTTFRLGEDGGRGTIVALPVG